MQTMTVAEVKSHFSDALDLVQKGEEIVISFGKRKEKVAVLVPFSRYAQKRSAALVCCQARQPVLSRMTLSSLMMSCWRHELPA